MFGILCCEKSRALTESEVALLQDMYGDMLDCDLVRVRLNTREILKIGGMVIGNTMFYPADTYSEDFSKEDLNRRTLFVHEAGHVWQNQNGINSVAKWISVRLCYGRDFYKSYLYTEGEEGVPFLRLPIERQARLFDSYYYFRERLAEAQDSGDVEGAEHANNQLVYIQSLLPKEITRGDPVFEAIFSNPLPK